MGALLVQPVQQNLRAKDVQKLLGISRSTLYALIQQEKLPKPFHIGRSSLWVASEIQAVIDKQVAVRDIEVSK